MAEDSKVGVVLQIQRGAGVWLEGAQAVLRDVQELEGEVGVDEV